MNRTENVLPWLALVILTAALACMVLYKPSPNKFSRSDFSGTDSFFTIKADTSYLCNSMSLLIENKSGKSASFYITPAEFNFYNTHDIVKSILSDSLSDKDKSIALWNFVVHNTYHGGPPENDPQFDNPAILVNAFEAGLCSNRNAALANLAAEAGIRSRIYNMRGHVLTELYFNNDWHVFDADKALFYARPDGTIASYDYMKRHPEIITEKNKELTNWIWVIKNNNTLRALKLPLISHNHIPAWGQKEYTSALQLDPGNSVCFFLNYNSLLSNYNYADLTGFGFRRLYQRVGYLNYTLTCNEEAANKRETQVFHKKFPYPIDQIEISTGQGNQGNLYDLYYSADDLHWFYKGSFGANHSTITFSLNHITNTSYTFNYSLKLVPVGQQPSAKSQFTVTGRFRFSDKILINNNLQACKVIPLNEAAKNLSLRFNESE